MAAYPFVHPCTGCHIFMDLFCSIQIYSYNQIVQPTDGIDLNSYRLIKNYNKIKKLFNEEKFDVLIKKTVQIATKRIWKSGQKKTLQQWNSLYDADRLDSLSKSIESFISSGFFRTTSDIRQDIERISKKVSQKIISRADKLLNDKYTIYNQFAVNYPRGNFSWRLDPLTGFYWPDDCRSFYLGDNKPTGTDIKTVWEIARFQFLSTIAYAYLLSDQERYARFAIDKVRLWIEENSFLEGPHWLMPMEAAIRLINWCAFLPLLDLMKFSNRLFIKSLARSFLEHLLFIRANMEHSIFRENNHYLSNIVGLMPARLLFPTVQWAIDCTGFAISEFTKEIQKQFDTSGMNFEGSLPYHRLSTEMSLFGSLITTKIGTKLPTETTERIKKIANFTGFYTNSCEESPVIGDNDSGLFVSLFPGQASNRHQYLDFLFRVLLENEGQAKNCDEYLCSLIFKKISLSDNDRDQPDGIEILGNKIPKTGNFDGLIISLKERNGLFFNTLQSSQGHTHNDKLAVYPIFDGKLLFIDRGSFSYTGYPEKRHIDRVSSSHNGPVINGWEQNRIWKDELFYIGSDAECYRNIESLGGKITIKGWHTGYGRFRRGLIVFRKVEWNTSDRVMMITDWIEYGGNKEQYTFSWNFLINPEWTTEVANKTFTFTNRSKKLYFEGAEKVGLTLDRGRFCPHYQRELPCWALKGTCSAEVGERIHFILHY